MSHCGYVHFYSSFLLHNRDSVLIGNVSSCKYTKSTLFTHYLSLDNSNSTAIADLASINTDNQTIDKFNLNGNSLELSLENDGQADQSVDLSSINTDNQTIDKLELDGTTLKVSLSNDGQTDQTVDLSSLVPIGTIQMWATATPPTGWLICDGSTFNASTYAELNTVLGGNTLPDFSGRFPLGVGNSGTAGSTSHSIGSNGGEETHTLTIDEMPAHSHGIDFLKRNKSGSGTDVSDLSDVGSSTQTNSEGGSQPHNNMPPFFTVNFIIKAE